MGTIRITIKPYKRFIQTFLIAGKEKKTSFFYFQRSPSISGTLRICDKRLIIKSHLNTVLKFAESLLIRIQKHQKKKMHLGRCSYLSLAELTMYITLLVVQFYLALYPALDSEPCLKMSHKK